MLTKRIFAALIFAPALLGFVFVGGLPLKIACWFISFLMLWEYLKLSFGTQHLYFKAIAFVCAVSLAVQDIVAAPKSLLLPVLALTILIAILLKPEPLEKSFINAALVFLGVVYCAGLLPYLSHLRQMNHGRDLALLALFATWGADTGAYFVGRLVGKHKLYATISPGKTVEGALGGWLSAIGSAFVLRALFSFELPTLHMIILATIAPWMGLLGDLCESMLKRAVGAKDSSNLIPGHGGVLDRFDAVMFVAPSVYMYAVLANL